MPMKKSVPAQNPDAYLASLIGWQRRYVQALRSTVVGTAPLQETIKWGHLVYFSNGPALLIRAGERRVLFGFWRGQRLRVHGAARRRSLDFADALRTTARARQLGS